MCGIAGFWTQRGNNEEVLKEEMIKMTSLGVDPLA